MSVGPRPPVVSAFGVEGDPVTVPGGEGVSFMVGGVVFKRVHDADEAEWTQALLSRIEPNGFRIPEPQATQDRRWVHEGWSASRFIDGLRPAAPSWNLIATAGLRFADAAEQARHGGQEVLSRRTHRWAIADRVAWAETQVELGPEASELRQWIGTLLGDGRREEHLVHGDLSGNVFLDRSDTAVILDVSPYLRPRRWAVAIVIADAVLWSGAHIALAETFASDPIDRDLFGRALIFRMVAEQLADNPRHSALLEPYREILTALT